MRLLRLGTLALFLFVVVIQAQPLSDPTPAAPDLPTVLSILVGLLVLNAVGLLVWNARKAAQTQAMSKTPKAVMQGDWAEEDVTTRARLLEQAAEVALQGASAEEVMDKARVLKQFYGDFLPKNFVERVRKINSDNTGRLIAESPFGTMLKRDVIQLLAQYPDQREQIIADFKSVFPYDFLDKLQAAQPRIQADLTRT
jgi:hypothetical protein